MTTHQLARHLLTLSDVPVVRENLECRFDKMSESAFKVEEIPNQNEVDALDRKYGGRSYYDLSQEERDKYDKLALAIGRQRVLVV